MINYHTELFLPILLNANKLTLLIIPIVYVKKYIEYSLYDHDNANASKDYLTEVLNDSFFYGLLTSIGIHVEFFDGSTKSVIASAVILSILSGVYLALSRYVFNDAPIKYILSKIVNFFKGIYGRLSNSLINLFKTKDIPIKRRRRRTRAEILAERNSQNQNQETEPESESEPKPEREDGKLEALAKAMADKRFKDMLMKISKESPINDLVDPVSNSSENLDGMLQHINKKISDGSHDKSSKYDSNNSSNGISNNLNDFKKEEKEISIEEVDDTAIDYDGSILIDGTIGNPIDNTQNSVSENPFGNLLNDRVDNGCQNSDSSVNDVVDDPIS